MVEPLGDEAHADHEPGTDQAHEQPGDDQLGVGVREGEDRVGHRGEDQDAAEEATRAVAVEQHAGEHPPRDGQRQVAQRQHAELLRREVHLTLDGQGERRHVEPHHEGQEERHGGEVEGALTWLAPDEDGQVTAER